MADLVPLADGQAAARQVPALSLLDPLKDPAGGPFSQRLRQFALQEPVRRALPVFLGVGAMGVAALAWSALSTPPQRVLYSQLDDSNRASVVAALDQSGVDYRIDNSTGALTVSEGDFYRARMLVAADGGVAAPQDGAQMLDSLPMGASRMLEGERLRAARERDLMLTIREIDGVESVRVHLAEGEKSVFVRDNLPPTASVMLRLAKGRQLSDAQVTAIVNLVAGSVPGLSVDSVRVVDQHGQLLSLRKSLDGDRLELQARMEQKLREQVAQLLTPMLGSGNFSTQVQVDLDMDEVTSARESYDKDGVVRSESQARSTNSAAGPAVGVPGVLSNTPPPAGQPQDRPPLGTGAQPQPQTNGESSSTRTFELGREVSVANSTPGRLRRLSVAVALSREAMKGTKPADLEQIRQLVSAAVGADNARGDQVAVITRKFEAAAQDEAPFYDAPWFSTAVRSAAAVLAVLLVLLLAIRPLIRALRRDEPSSDEEGTRPDGLLPAEPGSAHSGALAFGMDRGQLDEKVNLARRLVAEQPDQAVAALRQMLAESAEPGRDRNAEALA